MSESKPRAVYIGATSAAAIEAATEAEAGWLVKAIIAWALHDEPPKDVPPALVLVWRMVERESAMIHAMRAERANAGRLGGKQTQANASKVKQTEANASKRAEVKQNPDRIEGKRIEENNTPASAGVSRAPACVDGLDPSCPLTDEEVTHFAPAGMTPDEIRDWRDYYESREWKIEPNAPRPMTRAAARASLRRWHTMQGVREAREAHLDAKADERAAKRDARLSGPAPTDYAAIERLKEEAIRNSPTVNLDELP